jgi:hypothetical protein
MENRPSRQTKGSAHIDALYDGSIGKIRFSPDGNYELNVGGSIRTGKYAFFYLENHELLELRSGSGERETYLVESQDTPDSGKNRKALTLLRIRLGARGIQELHEGTISLTLAGE